MANSRPLCWVAEPTSSQAAESERTVLPIGCIAFLERASAQRSSKQHSCGRKEVCACAPHKAHFLPGDRYEMTAGVSNTRSSIGCRACLWPKSVKHQHDSSYPATKRGFTVHLASTVSIRGPGRNAKWHNPRRRYSFAAYMHRPLQERRAVMNSSALIQLWLTLTGLGLWRHRNKFSSGEQRRLDRSYLAGRSQYPASGARLLRQPAQRRSDPARGKMECSLSFTYTGALKMRCARNLLRHQTLSPQSQCRNNRESGDSPQAD